MKNSIPSKKIKLKDDLYLTIYPIGNHARIFEIENQEAEEFGEAPIQILESKRYEYELSKDEYQLAITSVKDCIIPSNSKTSRGIIAPGNYVGTLQLNIVSDTESLQYHIEVLATKFNATNDFDKSYRQNYRSMIEDITDKCTELLMQSNSPVNQYFEPDFTKENKTLYQKFSFVKSILNKEEFEESILKIFTSPKTSWISKEETVDIRSIKRFTNKNVQELLRGNNRIPLPINHSLYQKEKLESVPSKINSYKQEPSLDNPENRFIKHALQVYLQFCEDCSAAFQSDSKDQTEAHFIASKLENFLNHSFFKEISRPTTLKLNSPTLQRKSGYREILKSWLMFDLASKLTWKGGEDVYRAGKRDIATLYEYWLFFVLYDLFKTKFDLTKLTHEDEPYSHLFETTAKSINLIIKSGRHTALEGSTIIKNRALNIKFSFNRTFSGNKDSFPKLGSWTTAMRPDYTLTIWPKELTEDKAEIKEQIVHIHFDAKYKVNHFNIKSNDEHEQISKKEEYEDLKKQKEQERAGVYKNADLLKMHAYKDAIRRTGGAYILYPGTAESRFKGFHELIPGLGAFSLNPNNEKFDTQALSVFIDEVISHLVNRASHRENIAHKAHTIYKNKPNEISEPIPEYFNNEKLIPDDTYVLIGFSKNNERLKWYKENRLYNFRMDDNEGSLIFNNEVVNAKFLLLRESGKSKASQIFELKSGVRVFSKERLEGLGLSNLTNDNYLVYEFESDNIPEFTESTWDFKGLKRYQETVKGKNPRIAAGIPFTTTLSELMKVKNLTNKF